MTGHADAALTRVAVGVGVALGVGVGAGLVMIVTLPPVPGLSMLSAPQPLSTTADTLAIRMLRRIFIVAPVNDVSQGIVGQPVPVASPAPTLCEAAVRRAR